MTSNGLGSSSAELLGDYRVAHAAFVDSRSRFTEFLVAIQGNIVSVEGFPDRAFRYHRTSEDERLLRSNFPVYSLLEQRSERKQRTITGTLGNVGINGGTFEVERTEEDGRRWGYGFNIDGVRKFGEIVPGELGQ